MRNSGIIEELHKVDADILVLTETHSIINPGREYHQVSSNALCETNGIHYRKGEIRATVWSKVATTHEATTYDPNTSVCTLLPTALGELNVYGTVIGVFGNRNSSFLPDLRKQISDWAHIAKTGNICIAGDFNLSFNDSYYYTQAGRHLITTCFDELGIKNLTHGLTNNIDHIAVSESFVKSAKFETGVWNEDKKLSDHIGVWAVLYA
jgi:endonuclease/exonuclease/phosphatase family metal-dependent hydrolase